MHRVLVAGLAKPIFVCYECEAAYEKEEDIAAMRFRDFGQWAEEKGLDPNPAALVEADPK